MYWVRIIYIRLINAGKFDDAVIERYNTSIFTTEVKLALVRNKGLTLYLLY